MQTEELTGIDKHNAKVQEEKTLKWERRKAAIKDLREMKIMMPIATGLGGQLTTLLREKGHGLQAARYAISRMVKCRMYMYRMVRETHRYDLEGNPVELIAAEDKTYAKIELDRRNPKQYKNKENN